MKGGRWKLNTLIATFVANLADPQTSRNTCESILEKSRINATFVGSYFRKPPAYTPTRETFTKSSPLDLNGITNLCHANFRWPLAKTGHLRTLNHHNQGDRVQGDLGAKIFLANFAESFFETSTTWRDILGFILLEEASTNVTFAGCSFRN